MDVSNTMPHGNAALKWTGFPFLNDQTGMLGGNVDTLVEFCSISSLMWSFGSHFGPLLVKF